MSGTGSDNDEIRKITEFVDVTQCSPDEAQEYLSQAGWSVEQALHSFYNGQFESDSTASSGTNRPAGGTGQSSSSAGQASSGSAGGKQQSSGPRRFATLADLSNAAGSANSSPGMSDDDDDESRLFTGGEKSGLAVQNPDGPQARGGRLISDIFRQAQQNQVNPEEDDEDERPQQPRFSGTGFTLGTEDTPSRPVATDDGGAHPEAERPRKVVRRLTFWRDGFSVEDGPLYRYDDPANMQYLQLIKSGRAPLALLNVQNGESVDVHISRRTTEDYQAPKRPVGGFHGQGFRLGSPVPGELRSQSVSPQPAASGSSTAGQASGSATASQASREPVGSGDAQVQLRLGDGTVLRARFESSGPVQQLYDRVDSQPSTAGRSYVLQINFPRKELTDRQQSLKDAGAVGAVVTQKWT